jgi:iodotyrosine deiodinase
MAESYGFIDYTPHVPALPPKAAAESFLTMMRMRRSVREFSEQPVDRAIIERLIATAGTAPSGANKQPWRFIAVQDRQIKREIREAAEAEERAFYERRATEQWLRDLAPLGTDSNKPFLETAPWLIIVMKLMKDDYGDSAGDQVYYVNESVGIASGMLITAIHNAGLVTLTHTPSPMKFLARILNRPEYERPFLLLPVGYPAENCQAPNITKKPLSEIMVVDR